MPLLPLLLSQIRSRGPLTVAEFMELALYHPEFGYYCRAEQRSGTHGDFYTSVDVGPLFGATIAAQLAEMWDILQARGARAFDVVEAGAGNGRLAADVLDAAASAHPAMYAHLRLTLVERSAAARRAQAERLAPHAPRVVAMRDTLPDGITGVIYANELLDALPVHVVTRTESGWQEVAVGERDGALEEVAVPVSGPAVTEALSRVHGSARPGDRIELGLAAADWIRAAGAALREGFLLLFDYGRDTRTAAPRGTLTTYRAHRSRPEAWLEDPGGQDLTVHVDLDAVRRAAADAGLTTSGIVDQTYFLLALGLADRLETGHDRRAVMQRLAARTLMMPGGLGSTMKAMVFAKDVGTPALTGLASGRLT